MTKFTVHTIETAPDRSRPLLEGVKQAFGFVPNLYAVFAESPAALQGALAIADAFSASTLCRAPSNSSSRSPSPRRTTASSVWRRTRPSPNALRRWIRRWLPRHVAREPLSDPKLDALVTFTRKLVEQRGFVADADVAAFLEAGYTQGAGHRGTARRGHEDVQQLRRPHRTCAAERSVQGRGMAAKAEGGVRGRMVAGPVAEERCPLLVGAGSPAHRILLACSY